LIKEFANQRSFFFIFDAREEFCAEFGNRGRFVERQLLVNLTTLEMAWLAACLKDWFDVDIKVRFFAWR